MNSIKIEVQIASTEKEIPPSSDLISWSKAALEKDEVEITIRIVDEEESATLNKAYRNKIGPTNVLSFPMSSAHDPNLLLGDIIICAPLVRKEAEEQSKTITAHFAHLMVHGTLHLQGYDHLDEGDAKIMEQREIDILSQFGISNPYEYEIQEP